MTPQYEAGTDFFERTADGTIGVNQIDPPILKRMSLQTDLISVDPDMTPYILSARELVTTAPVSGTGFALSEGVSTRTIHSRCGSVLLVLVHAMPLVWLNTCITPGHIAITLRLARTPLAMHGPPCRLRVTQRRLHRSGWTVQVRRRGCRQGRHLR